MEKQVENPYKRYPVNFWVDKETNDRLERRKMFYGGRSHIARQALLKELDRLEQERNNTPKELKAS